ncbi:hypothetical protein AAG906_001034 [Vitis piasezkii]
MSPAASYFPYPFLVKFGMISQWTSSTAYRSDGKTSIMVVVDRLSKSAHFIAIAHPYTAKTIANKFVEGGQRRQTEVVNRCIEQYLRRFVHHKPRHWNSSSMGRILQAMIKTREVNFEVGDWVYLRLQPYRQQSVFRRTSHKLSNRYYGPYQIEERIGPVAYKLKLSPGSRIHPMFHVSLLKKKIGEVAIANDELPPPILVLWEGLPKEEATWEDSPDKVLIERGSIDESQVGTRSSRPRRKRHPNPKYAA